MESTFTVAWKDAFRTGGVPSGDMAAFPPKDALVGRARRAARARFERHRSRRVPGPEYATFAPRSRRTNGRSAALPHGGRLRRLPDHVARGEPPGARSRPGVGGWASGRRAASRGCPCYSASMAVRKPPETVWRPIEDLPPGAENWGSAHYRERAARWHEVRARLQDPGVDRTLLDIWLRERNRAFAIETGQIEGLYTLRRGVTEQLIAEGFSGVRAVHAVEAGLSDDTLRGVAGGPARRHRVGLRGRQRPAPPDPPLAEELAPASHAAPGVRPRGA